MSILRLQHTRSDGEVDTYHLKSIRRYHIGRGSNCEVRILDLKMSRQHCAIERQGSEWLVHDLGSTNGIKLDGNRIQGSAMLAVGSVIKAGNTRLEVSDIDGGGDEADLTPVRQEALPADESDDERGVAESVRQADDDEATLEPQSGRSSPTSGALQAYQRPPSDEFELSGEVASLRAAPAPTHDQEPTSEPEPDEFEPEADDADDAVARVESSPTPVPAEAEIEAASPDDGELELELDDAPAAAPAPEPAAPAARSESQAVKPVTIRVGTGRHPAVDSHAKDSSSSLYINVMGRRIGPLSRAEAREIKARELKGTLTEADLAKYPGA